MDPHPHRPSQTLSLAQRFRQAQPPVAPQRRAYRSGARVHRLPGQAGPHHRVGNCAAGPAPQGFRALPPRRPAAVHPTRSRRRDAPWQRPLVLLPGVGAPGRAAQTMADRLAPYIRYYSSQRPTDDKGVRPAVLVVFDDDIAASHFLRVVGNEMVRAKVNVPVQVAYESALERLRPLRGAWQSPGHWGHATVMLRRPETL